MGRKPNYDHSKLPQWVQDQISELNDKVADLLFERQSLLNQMDNMEYALEHMAEQLEEQYEIAPGTFVNTVDL